MGNNSHFHRHLSFDRASSHSRRSLLPSFLRSWRSGHARTEGGRIAGGVVGSFLIVAIIGVVLYYTFGKVVPPGYFGVRQVTAGPGQGFSREGLLPGLHFTVPFFVNVHLVPRTVQVLNFHRDAGEVTGIAATHAPHDREQFSGLEVRTSDGLAVVVGISLLTRFYATPSQDTDVTHGGPADLFTRVGMSPNDWDNQVRKVAADELRRALGALLAREFYESPTDRSAAIDRATREMQMRLNPMGIAVESVLLRRFTYKDDRFDEAIFNKNIQEQEQRLKEASGALAEVKAELEQVAASWDAKVETTRIKGENEAQIIRSEAALYENEKKAEGDLAVARAQADVDRLKASALASSQGAAVYVAREMAPLLSSLRGGIVSNIDPYDIAEWAKRLGVGTGTPGSASITPGSAVAGAKPSAATSGLAESRAAILREPSTRTTGGSDASEKGRGVTEGTARSGAAASTDTLENAGGPTP